MYELIALFFNICRLKKGPQDIPFSNMLFQVLVVIYSAMVFLVFSLSSGFLNSMLQVVVEVLFTLGSIWVTLFIAKKSARFQQTANAILATNSIITFITLPAMATLIGQGTLTALIAVVLFMLWQWVVSGHILSMSLDQPFLFGLGIAFLYILISYQLMTMVFPETN